MKTVIHCDEVFDILTRAPFPGGDDNDAEVELHLAACHECRRLAEALRPAVGLFHESLAQENQHLPAYLGDVEAATAVRVRYGLAGPAARWLPITAAVACVLCVGALMLKGRASTGLTEQPLAAAHSGVDSWMALLDGMRLPSACRETRPGDRVTGMSQQCCTRCHHADSEVAASPRAIAKSVEACLICHDEWQTSLQHCLPLPGSGLGVDYDGLQKLRDLSVPGTRLGSPSERTSRTAASTAGRERRLCWTMQSGPSLALEPLSDFFPLDGDLGWGIERQLDAVSTHLHHRHDHVIANIDLLVLPAT